MTIYKTSRWGKDVIPVECTRVTDASVFIQGHYRERRHARHSEYEDYFETEEEAVSFLRSRLTKRAEVAARTLEEVQRDLAAVNQRYGAVTA
jgi:hypothetical protein